MADGNTAAIREALNRVGDICLYIKESCDEGDTARYMAEAINDIIDAALAEPPRNCDRYHTVEEAFAACHEDRGYLSDPVAERRSTISFMLSVAQKEPKFEQCEGESAQTEGDKHGI